MVNMASRVMYRCKCCAGWRSSLLRTCTTAGGQNVHTGSKHVHTAASVAPGVHSCMDEQLEVGVIMQRGLSQKQHLAFEGVLLLYITTDTNVSRAEGPPLPALCQPVLS